MRRTLSALLLCLLAWPAWAQSVKMPEAVTAAPGRLAAVKVEWTGDDFRYTNDLALDVFREYDPDPQVVRLRFIGYTPGTYKIQAIACKDKKLCDFVACFVVISGTPPAPPVPPEPAPTPGKVTVPAVVGKDWVTAFAAVKAAGLTPKTVGSVGDPITAQEPTGGTLVDAGSTVTLTTTPAPSPAPIPVAGMRVLIVYETAELSKMTAAQYSILFSKTVRDAFNAACVVGSDGKTKEWRIYDKDVDLSGEAKHWQDAIKRPRTQTPWIILSNGTAGHEGPLPATAEATLELLNKYAPKSMRKAG